MYHSHSFFSFFKGRTLPILLLLSLLVSGVALQQALPASAANTTYYVDCAAGNDANNGTSTSTPWRTMARASQQTYGSGDSILFKRGATCTGTGFKPVGNGTVASPVTIADYGSGNLPVLNGSGTNEPALLLKNVQNYVVRNLDLTQQGQTVQGIDDAGKDTDRFSDEYMRAVVHILGLGPVGVINCGEACTVRNITLDSIVVHDGEWNGIYSGAGFYQLDTNTYGYVDNVVIQNTESRNNHKSGIEFTSTYTKDITYHTTNVKVLNSYLHDNGGDGIMAGPLDHALFDGNECAFNGLLRDARLGCWSWDSHDVVIQFSESHHNVTPATDKGARDGGGYDCDLGSEDCLIQYSWSHDNQGEGYLLMTWPIGFGFARGVSHNMHMRYNIGERDGKKLAGGIYNFGGVETLVIYNNTIYYEPARVDASEMVCSEGAPICHDIWGKSGAPTGYVFNNIFITNGTVNPSATSNNHWSDGTGTWTFNRNLYYRVEGGVRFVEGGTICTTFACWQGLGRDVNGLNANPLFSGAFGGGPAAYQLKSGSPAINAGQTVTQGLRGMGTRDYFGNSIPQGGAFDIGAHESSGAGGPTATPPPPTNTPTRTNTPAPTNTPGGPTNTPAPTNTPTRTNTPAPTATPGGSTVMHVLDIFTTDSAGNPKSTFIKPSDDPFWRVKIVDQNNNPVSGAAVISQVLRPDGSHWISPTATTGTDGWALFSANIVNNSPVGTYTINVTSVTKTGATYNPSANVKSSTTFVVQ